MLLIIITYSMSNSSVFSIFIDSFLVWSLICLRDSMMRFMTLMIWFKFGYKMYLWPHNESLAITISSFEIPAKFEKEQRGWSKMKTLCPTPPGLKSFANSKTMGSRSGTTSTRQCFPLDDKFAGLGILDCSILKRQISVPRSAKRIGERGSLRKPSIYSQEGTF